VLGALVGALDAAARAYVAAYVSMFGLLSGRGYVDRMFGIHRAELHRCLQQLQADPGPE